MEPKNNNFKRAKGRKEYIDFLEGKKLTRKEAILANCYSCTIMGDERVRDCGNMSCPLHPFMPYGDQDLKGLNGRCQKNNQRHSKTWSFLVLALATDARTRIPNMELRGLPIAQPAKEVKTA